MVTIFVEGNEAKTKQIVKVLYDTVEGTKRDGSGTERERSGLVMTWAECARERSGTEAERSGNGAVS